MKYKNNSFLLNEIKRQLLNEWKSKSDNVAVTIRETLKNIFQGTRFWGKIQNPDNNCETNEGVIYLYPHLEGQDEWSIINRFDTNTIVRGELMKRFLEESGDEEYSEKKFIQWISANGEKLFKDIGKNGYTTKLVSLNQETIDKGNRNEMFSIDALKNYFGDNAIIKRFCSGDRRDTLEGKDISVEINGNQYHVQVKPFESINSYVDKHEGDTFFRVKTRIKISKYSEKNVDILFLVNYSKSEYIAFSNEKRRIVQTSDDYINFYEPWLMTNIEFKSEKKPKVYNKFNLNKQDEVKQLFNTSQRRLDNLLYKKQALEDLIKIELNKIKKLKSNI